VNESGGQNDAYGGFKYTAQESVIRMSSKKRCEIVIDSHRQSLNANDFTSILDRQNSQKNPKNIVRSSSEELATRMCAPSRRHFTLNVRTFANVLHSTHVMTTLILISLASSGAGECAWIL
jgi:hypothetical protein